MIGWAVTVDDKIDMRTVGPTRRAAIINWMVTERKELITNFTSDRSIDMKWSRYENGEVRVQQVDVKIRDDATETKGEPT